MAFATEGTHRKVGCAGHCFCEGLLRSGLSDHSPLAYQPSRKRRFPPPFLSGISGFFLVPKLFAVFEDAVDEAVISSFLGGHVIVAVGVPVDSLQVLAGVLGKNAV